MRAIVFLYVCFVTASVVEAHATVAPATTSRNVQVCQPLTSYLKDHHHLSSLPTGTKGQKGEKGSAGETGSIDSLCLKGESGNRSKPGIKGTKGEPGITKHSSLVASTTNAIPHCNSTMRGALHLVQSRGADVVMICRNVGHERFNWTQLSFGDTNGRHTEDILTDSPTPKCGEVTWPSTCSDILKNLKKSKCPISNGLYHILDSQETKTLVYCDMTTAGGGWQLIGKAFQPQFQLIGFTNEPITMTSRQGWSNRFSKLVVKDFRVQFSSSSSLKDTKGHWYYHFNNSRPLSLLFAEGSADGCDRSGVWGMKYTFDFLTNKDYKQHKCSRTQDESTSMNGCFGLSTCDISDNDGSFSFHATNAESGLDVESTAFFGCDDGSCCGCWGPTGGQASYCNNGCRPSNGGTTSSNAFAWFYIR